MMLDKLPTILGTIARELAISLSQVTATVTLLDDGNTIPFIARYRKEVTGGLDEVQIRDIQERLEYLRKLAERRDAVKAEIASQEKLTDELAAQLDAAATLQVVEDLYRPYKPKRQTRAAVARERGLEPLAQAILAQATGRGGRGEVISPLQMAAPFVTEQVPDVEAALAGARDIIAEQASDDAATRNSVRRRFAADGFVISLRASDEADAEGRYRVYYDFRCALRTVQPHQWLALQRGGEDGSLKVRMETPDGAIVSGIAASWIKTPTAPAAEQVRLAIEDGYDRLLRPSIEREVSGQLSEFSGDHAIQVFAANLRNLLLQPPLRERAVMGIDPGFRTGCKVATVDPTGKLLHTVTIYPHEPRNEREKSLQALAALVATDKITVIAIGNGTASRETEALVAELIQTFEVSQTSKVSSKVVHLAFVMVSEAGASVYSASDIARAEFPDLDVSMRGAVSIARRLQDPLAELVKIDPQSIGVGLYQHDVDQKKLAAALDAVVESVVNYVGVDVNTASAALLGYVAGISKRLAAAIVEHRDANGPFGVARRAQEGQGAGAESVRAGGRLLAGTRQPQPAGQHDHPPRIVRGDQDAARSGRPEHAHGGSAESAAGVVRGERVDDRRRTTDDGRRTTDDGRPTTDDRRWAAVGTRITYHASRITYHGIRASHYGRLGRHRRTARHRRADAARHRGGADSAGPRSPRQPAAHHPPPRRADHRRPAGGDGAEGHGAQRRGLRRVRGHRRQAGRPGAREQDGEEVRAQPTRGAGRG